MSVVWPIWQVFAVPQVEKQMDVPVGIQQTSTMLHKGFSVMKWAISFQLRTLSPIATGMKREEQPMNPDPVPPLCLTAVCVVD